MGVAVPPPAPHPRAPAVELAAATVTPGARQVQWVGMLLLLLGAPRSFTEGAATALTPDSVLEWQGECPQSRWDQIGTSGGGVVKAEEGGVKLGAGRRELLRS